MKPHLDRDDTGRTLLDNLAVGTSAATNPVAMAWRGSGLRRWDPISETSKGSLAQVFVSQIVSRGAHDVVSAVLQPCQMQRVVYSFHARERLTFTSEESFQRMVFGSSSLENKLGNAVVKEVEDALFSKRFLDLFGAALTQISSLDQLPEGWDSYGAGTIDEPSREAAARLLSAMFSKHPTIPPPVVGASPSGGVVLQWHLPNIELYAEVGSEICEFYVARPQERGVLDEGTISTDDIDELATRLTKFLP